MKLNILRSLRFRIVLLQVIAAILLIAYFVIVISTDSKQEHALFDSRLMSKESIFASNIKVSSNQTYLLANEYTYWDDMVNFVEGGGKDESFASDLPTALSTYNANVIWIFNTKHQLVYSLDDQADDLKGFNEAKTFPLNPNDFSVLFSKNGVYSYYISTPQGIFEIDGATIHPSDDAARKTPSHGYFFVGRILKGAYLNDLGKSIEGTVRADSNPESALSFKDSYDLKADTVTVGKPLYDYSQRPIGVLYGVYTANDLKQALNKQATLNTAGLVIFSVLIVGVLIFHIRAVVIPLNDIERSLASGSDAPIKKLMPKQQELGSIARLVADSFMQQRLLTAQKATVEKEVQTQTEQLKNEETTLKTLIDSLPVGVHVVEAPSGKTVTINATGLKLLGLSAPPNSQGGEYSQGYDIIRADGKPYPEEELPMNITLREGKTARADDLVVRRPDGSRAFLRATTSPVLSDDGTMHTAVGVFEDIAADLSKETTAPDVVKDDSKSGS